MRTVFASLRRRARKRWGIERARCGAVTFVQRFGDALNLNVHFHSLVLDGVYESKLVRAPSLPSPRTTEQPLLAELSAASVAGRIAAGRRAGQRVLRVGDRIDPEDFPALEGERCANASGVSLHANVAVPARDRHRLERLCRYVARPPAATERLSRLEDGRLLLGVEQAIKRFLRDGPAGDASPACCDGRGALTPGGDESRTPRRSEPYVVGAAVLKLRR